MECSQQKLQYCAYWYCLFQHWGVNMTSYSGYVEHSDFYIRPQSYQDAFDFLCQLAVESDEDAFYIGKVSEKIDDFDLYDVVKFKWNEDRGAWVQYDHR